MSITRILLLVLLTNSTLYCWATNNIKLNQIDTLPSKNLFEWQQYSGNLKEVLNYICEVSPEYIFSDEMSLVEDSIFIDLEFQKEFVHSDFFLDLILSTIQRKYKFRIRDTLLAETETVYVISISDELKLERNEVGEGRFFLFGNDSKNQYDLGFCFGYYLKQSKNILELVKLVDNQNGKQIPVVSDIPKEYDGLYNFAIPMHSYNADGSAKYFGSLLEVNPVLIKYGLQVQKVTRPIVGKVIEFFGLPTIRPPYKFDLKN